MVPMLTFTNPPRGELQMARQALRPALRSLRLTTLFLRIAQLAVTKPSAIVTITLCVETMERRRARPLKAGLATGSAGTSRRTPRSEIASRAGGHA